LNRGKSSQAPSPAVEPGARKPRTAPIIVAVYIAAVALIVGIPFYQVYLAPWREIVLTVGEDSYNMRYLVKKLRLTLTDEPGVDTFAVATNTLQDIQKRALISQEANRRGITASDEEIEQEIKRRVENSATGTGSFEELYESMLRGLRLTEKDFRELVHVDILRAKLSREFMNKLAAGAEQVRILVIVAGTAQEAEELRDRLNMGADFSQLAREKSIDLKSSRQGGDLGWIPKGIENLSATAQVRAWGILSKTEDEALALRNRILAGEDFASLARKNSIDDESRSKNGYLGWVSTSYQSGKQYAAETYDLNPGDLSQPISTHEGFWIIKLIEKSPEGRVIDDIAFAMDVGQASPPLETEQGFYLIKLAEKADARPLSPEHLNILAKDALNRWLDEEIKKGTEQGWITWNWGSDIYNWAIGHSK